MKKIVLTGSKGFIGYHYKKFAERDCHVVGFDKQNGQDLSKKQGLLPKCDVVVHMAATNGTSLFYQKPTEILINDSKVTLNLVERYRKSKTKLVFTSSSEIFNGAVDLGFYPVPTDENVPIVFNDITNPRWSYGLPKAMGENLISNCGNPWLIIRYFNIYGPGQTHHFVNEFIERVKKGQYFINGNDTRSFCYIDDAVQMTHELVKSQENKIVNIGNPTETRISDVAKVILKIMGISPDRLEIRDSPKGSVSRRCPDTSLVKSLTNFDNYTDIRDGLFKTIESTE